MNCRFCKKPLKDRILDLGEQPLCNNNIPFGKEKQSEHKYPLELYLCNSCLLVQVSHNIPPEEIFSEYTYLSSYSSTWVQHAKDFVDNTISKFNINTDSFVVEIASNDGYLLQFFKNKNIPHLGVEPAKNVANIARNKGIDTINEFFSVETANLISEEYGMANLIVANNVLAHVPDINDFIQGIKILLADDGIFSIEVPYLRNLLEGKQFDTIYHEHFFYYSVTALNNILKKYSLSIKDIKELRTHGGSLRLTVKHDDNKTAPILEKYLSEELVSGLNTKETFFRFSDEINTLKKEFTNTIKSIRKNNNKIAAYGAPGKGNTLLNFFNLDSSLISFTVDRNPIKQNTYLPGSRIPVYEPTKINDEKPEFILILPWNLKDEIIQCLEHTKDWSAKFIIPIPELTII